MPPDNGGYMVAAYAITAVILVGYAVALWRRARRAVRSVSRDA
jgi:cytochrome oxidase assembly protein ShyY1